MADEPASTEPASGGGGPTGGDPDSPKADRKKQVKNERILIIVGVLGLILTYVFIKRSSANSATTAAQSPTTTTATSPYGYASDPYSSGEGYAGGYDDSAVATDLAAIQAELAGLTPPVTTPASGAAPTTTTVTSQTNSGLTPITTDVAQTVQADLNSGTAVYYNAGTGAGFQPVSQPTAGGPWLASGLPLTGNPTGAPGNPSEYYSGTLQGQQFQPLAKAS